MKLSTFLLTLTLLITSILSASLDNFASASDLAKEQRIAEQTIDSLFIGEPLWLSTAEPTSASQTEQVASNKFLALLDADPQSATGIILIHGTGQGPDTPFVIGPLRELLSEKGYTTLSLQMPVLNEGTDYQDYRAEFELSRARISAAIDYLQNNSTNKVVLLGHSMGSSMLMDWVATHGSDRLAAIVVLGLGATGLTKKSLLPSTIKLPVLDIYGEQDYPAVVQNASKRQSTIRNTDKRSIQVTIPAADHFFNGKEADVAQQILSWLKSTR